MSSHSQEDAPAEGLDHATSSRHGSPGLHSSAPEPDDAGPSDGPSPKSLAAKRKISHWQKINRGSNWAKIKILSIVRESWLRSRALYVPPPKLSDEQKKEFQQMFMMLDENGSGAAPSDNMHNGGRSQL